ncbi:unnamed protein product [Choristocarpus tenellus]
MPRTLRKAFDQGIIDSAFKFSTFVPQGLFALMILAPRSRITRSVMEPWWPTLTLCLCHVLIVAVSLAQPGGSAPMALFSEVFEPSGNGQLAAIMHMYTYSNFAAEEWSHVLTWDLFVGRYIWLDGLRSGVSTRASVLVTNFIGPLGFLVHVALSLASGKGMPQSSLGPPSVEGDETEE